MNNSLSFDRAADFYDQTRPLPEAITRQGVQAILEQVGLRARILDVGTGTGRISIPLLEQGADLVGCDLSASMLRRLQEKRPGARILQADASRLPFPSAQFEAVLTVHVIHLIAPWQEALREFKRVLVPGGVYLNVRTYNSVGKSIRDEIRRHWRDWVEAHGVKIHQPGVQDYEPFLQELRQMGANLTEVEVVRFPIPFTLRQHLDRFTGRVFSDAWDIPDDVYAASLEELRPWVAQKYGDLDEPRSDEVRFTIDAARFAGV